MGNNLGDRVAAIANPDATIIIDAQPLALEGTLEPRPQARHTPAGAATAMGGVTDKISYARALAEANLLPAQYRGKPGNLLWAIEFAEMLGVHPMQAITGVHVIDGKPSASADLMAARVRAAGHRLRIAGDDTYAEATLIRRDDPEYPFTVRWTLDRAKEADLAGKGTWKKYPAAMLRARAITEVCRMGASEVLMGVLYTPEELGRDVDAEGQPVTPDPAPWQPPAAQPDPPAEPADTTTADEWAEAVGAATTLDQARALWKDAAGDRELVTAEGAKVADLIMARVDALKAAGPAAAEEPYHVIPDADPAQATIPSGDYMEEASQ